MFGASVARDFQQRQDFTVEFKKGGVFTVQSGSDANMTGRQDPGSAWKATRMGPEPTQAHVDLRSEAARDMLAAVGLSGALFDNRADGTARREAFR